MKFGTNEKNNIVSWAEAQSLKMNITQYNTFRTLIAFSGEKGTHTINPKYYDGVVSEEVVQDDQVCLMIMQDILGNNADTVGMTELLVDVAAEVDKEDTGRLRCYFKVFARYNSCSEYGQKLKEQTAFEGFLKYADAGSYCVVMGRNGKHVKAFLVYLKAEYEKVKQLLADKVKGYDQKIDQMQQEHEKLLQNIAKQQEKEIALNNELESLRMERSIEALDYYKAF